MKSYNSQVPALVVSIVIMLIMSINIMTIESFQLSHLPMKTSPPTTTTTSSSRTIHKMMLQSPTTRPPKQNSNSFHTLYMSSENTEDKPKTNNLPMLLDPGTKGGALFLSLVLFIIPIIIYEVVTLGLGVDGVEAGKWIGVGFTFFTTVLWVSTYIFRVATKDMTYVSAPKSLLP